MIFIISSGADLENWSIGSLEEAVDYFKQCNLQDISSDEENDKIHTSSITDNLQNSSENIFNHSVEKKSGFNLDELIKEAALMAKRNTDFLGTGITRAKRRTTALTDEKRVGVTISK